MKTLYIECNMGVAGDMLCGALLDTLENKQEFIDKFNHIGIPDTAVSFRQDEKCGIVGTHVIVKVSGKEECEDMHHSHEHNHIGDHHGKNHSHHGNDHLHNAYNHTHTTMKSVSELIDALNVSEQIKDDVRAVYRIIAEAESKAHGKEVSQIHFHEVGMMDALADITACCLLIRQIGPEKIVVSPIKTGYGHVHCAHGVLPVPAPATATILKGIPNSSGEIESELCTPTGAALIKYFADEYSYQPEMNVEKIGYGTGVKDFPVANCVRVMIGESADEGDGAKDTMIELACNLDDMTGEDIGYAVEKISEGKAVDVYTTAISMKKSRPGIKLSVLCKPKDKEEVVRDIFHYTTTIGIREYQCRRYILNRTEELRQTPLGKVRVKLSEGYGTRKEKIEYEDLKKIDEL